MNLRDFKFVFTSNFYKRKEGESTSLFMLRTIVGMNIAFVFVGLPFMCILAIMEGESIPEYLLCNALPAYIGLIVGGTIGLLIRET